MVFVEKVEIGLGLWVGGVSYLEREKNIKWVCTNIDEILSRKKNICPLEYDVEDEQHCVDKMIIVGLQAIVI